MRRLGQSGHSSVFCASEEWALEQRASKSLCLCLCALSPMVTAERLLPLLLLTLACFDLLAVSIF